MQASQSAIETFQLAAASRHSAQSKPFTISTAAMQNSTAECPVRLKCKVLHPLASQSPPWFPPACNTDIQVRQRCWQVAGLLSQSVWRQVACCTSTNMDVLAASATCIEYRPCAGIKCSKADLVMIHLPSSSFATSAVSSASNGRCARNSLRRLRRSSSSARHGAHLCR